MKNSRKNLAADAAYMLQLILLFICVVYIVVYAENTGLSIAILCFVFAVMIITHFTSITLGLILNIGAIFVTATVLIYRSMTQGAEVNSEIYFWFVMGPLMTFVSSLLFRHTREIEDENRELNSYVKDFRLIDAQTGLKTLQAYEMEMPVYQRIANRYEMGLLMIVWEFRYAGDLKRMVGKNKLEQVADRISAAIVDAFRKEDIVYLLSREPYQWGTLMLTREGTEELMMERMKQKFNSLDLKEILGKNAPRLEMRIGMQEAGEQDTAFSLYDKAKRELQYDV